MATMTGSRPRPRPKRTCVLLAALVASTLAAPPTAAPTRAAGGPNALAARLEDLARTVPWPVGIAALHLETGRRAAWNGGRRFPMASVYKVAIAVTALRAVDEGRLSLARPVRLTARDLRPGYSPIAAASPGGTTLRLEELIETMIVTSDNTASDAVLALAGGPAAVNRALERLGVRGVRVDRPELEIIRDLYGVRSLPRPWSLAAFDAAAARVPLEEREAAVARFLKDPRDTATPDGMVDLLAAIARGRAGTPQSGARLRGWLESTATAGRRLAAALPPGTRVAHKTGTAATAGAFNDAGIVTLPGGAGHVVIAVFTSGAQVLAAEDLIARAGRIAFDHWAAR